MTAIIRQSASDPGEMGTFREMYIYINQCNCGGWGVPGFNQASAAEYILLSARGAEHGARLG